MYTSSRVGQREDGRMGEETNKGDDDIHSQRSAPTGGGGVNVIQCSSYNRSVARLSNIELWTELILLL